MFPRGSKERHDIYETPAHFYYNQSEYFAHSLSRQRVCVTNLLVLRSRRPLALPLAEISSPRTTDALFVSRYPAIWLWFDSAFLERCKYRRLSERIEKFSREVERSRGQREVIHLLRVYLHRVSRVGNSIFAYYPNKSKQFREVDVISNANITAIKTASMETETSVRQMRRLWIK